MKLFKRSTIAEQIAQNKVKLAQEKLNEQQALRAKEEREELASIKSERAATNARLKAAEAPSLGSKVARDAQVLGGVVMAGATEGAKIMAMGARKSEPVIRRTLANAAKSWQEASRKSAAADKKLEEAAHQKKTPASESDLWL